LSAISQRVRERDIRRKIQYNRVRKAAVRHNYLGSYVTNRIPVLLPEFLKMTLGSLIGFWIIAKLLAYLIHANPLYTLALFGLLYSMQATYYKYRLSVDPDYKIPKCRCAGRRNDNAETVLQSRESAILRIPNAVLGVVLYSALLLAVYLKHADTAMLAAIMAILVSVYLSYVMVVKIASLCVNCINVAALNVLILWHLWH
jgi:uncharacterized membrane protein